MSTLITDTLKPKTNNFPLMDAEDLDIINESNLEEGLKPSTDSKLGRVMVGETIDIDVDGVISLPNFLTIDKDEPTDGSLFWLDTNTDPQKASDDGRFQLLSTSYLPGVNGLEHLEDGFYVKGTKGEYPEIYYVNDYPFMLIASMTLYINAATGDDTTGNGSAEKPFKTWTKARTKLPRNLNRCSITVYFSGDFTALETYEDFEFYGGGFIYARMQNRPKFSCIRTYGETSLYIYDAFDVQLKSAVSNYVGCLTAYCGSSIILNPSGSTAYTVNLTGISTKNETSGSTAKPSGSCNRGVYAVQGGYIGALNSLVTINAKTCYQAYLAETGGEVGVYKATGSNVTQGLVATTGGTLRYGSYSITVVSGGTARTCNTGGRIYTGAGGSVGNY